MLSRFFLTAVTVLAGASLLPNRPGSLFRANAGSAPPAPEPYRVPEGSAAVLGKVSGLVQHATILDKDRFRGHGATFVGKLPGGEVYFEVPSMDVDDDGSAEGAPAGWVARPVRGGKVDNVHQDQTSYGGRLPKLPGQSDGISPFQVPYVVLPGHTKPYWFAQQKIEIGDGAVVIRGGQVIEAVFADAGPDDKIGEMSLKAHQMFGEKVIVPGAKAKVGSDGKPLRDPATGKLLTEPALVTRNSASKGPFVVIVFPGTSAGRDFQGVDASLKSVIDQRFHALTQ